MIYRLQIHTAGAWQDAYHGEAWLPCLLALARRIYRRGQPVRVQLDSGRLVLALDPAGRVLACGRLTR